MSGVWINKIGKSLPWILYGFQDHLKINATSSAALSGMLGDSELHNGSRRFSLRPTLIATLSMLACRPRQRRLASMRTG
jgi:hypothetical protein